MIKTIMYDDQSNIEIKSWPYCYHELHSEPEREEIFNFTLNWIREKICLE